ncbi:hypothetical protein Tco_0133622 [Tanacetum coccineum]
MTPLIISLIESFAFEFGKRILVASNTTRVWIILSRIMKLSFLKTIILKEKKRVVAVRVPLLMLIFLNMIRSSLIFRSIHFLLPIGVIFIKRSSPVNFAHIISLSEYDHFCFKIEPEPGNLTMDVVEDIFPTREPRVHVPNVLPTHPTLHLDLDYYFLVNPLFAYIVWIFLPFLTYPVAPPYLLSCGNEDTIFDPGISIYHSFMPDVSHRSGTFN